MNGDEIAHLINVLETNHVGDLAAQMPGRIYRDIRIISIDIHAEIDGCVCNAYANGTKADDADLFSLQFDACKLLLFLLCRLGNIRIVPVCAYPVDALDNIAGSKEHACKNKLCDAVGVGAGCVEHHDSRLRTALQGDVVDARSCTCNGKQVVGKLHVMHGCASDQNAVCVFDIAHLLILGGEVF